MSSPLKTNHERGFTLIEIITGLVISGFIAAMLGSGLVYSVKLYQNLKGLDEILPQIDATINFIRHTIKSGEFKESETFLCGYSSQDDSLYDTEHNSLMYNQKYRLLRHVDCSSFKIDPNAVAFSDSEVDDAKLYRITLRVEVNGVFRNFDFDVSGDSK